MALANPAPDYFEPEDGMFLATLLIVRDLARSREYYERVFGATCVHESSPLIMQFFNSYIIINVEGGPTDDKPTVQAKAPADSNTLSCAMNVRVRDIRKLYEEWKSRGRTSSPSRRTTERRSAATCVTRTATWSRWGRASDRRAPAMVPTGRAIRPRGVLSSYLDGIMLGHGSSRPAPSCRARGGHSGRRDRQVRCLRTSVDQAAGYPGLRCLETA